MNLSPTSHPSEQVLRGFALGKLDDAATDEVNLHLEACADCRERVGTMSADSFLGRFQGKQGQVAVPRAAAAVQAALDLATLPPGLVENPDYEIIKELGRGGMGVVYLVHNKLMGRDEAVKIIGKHLIERPEVLERFLREIRSVARLHHENLVTAYSASRMGESLVYAMEYVDGQDLSRLVKLKGPLPVAHAAYFIHQTALGLQHAHENAIVHRDIKPGNLMLTAQGKRRLIKILDFGLTKVLSEKGVDGSLTMQGQMLGTPDYIAPEQIRDAQSADIRADIYSLGCTLYYLLTGRPPFQMLSLYDLLQAHHSMDAHPLNLVRPEVPAELACLVSKMMAKEPRRRFQTPVEVARALTPFFKSPARLQPGLLPAALPVVEGEEPAATATLATPAPAPVVPPPPAANEPRWDSLIEFKQTEKSVVPATPTPATEAPRQPPGKSRRIVVGAGGLAAFVALGITIYVNFRDDGGVEAKLTITPSKPATKPSADQTKTGNASQRLGSADSGPDASLGGNPSAPSVEPLKTFTNSLGMKLALIPAGEFVMGMSPEAIQDLRKSVEGTNEVGFFDNQTRSAPQHHVRLAKPWLMGVTEVTIGQFKEFIKSTGYVTQAEQYGSGNSEETSTNAKVTDAMKKMTWRTPGYSVTDDSPVTQVTWNDAVAFCNWLSEQEKLKPCYQRNANQTWSLVTTGDGYRLPTEAEWEYACRAGSTDEPTTLDGFAWLKERAWYEGNLAEGARAHPVAQKRPNGYGLFDMRGNVFEWCHDVYDSEYYRESPPNDPLGPSERGQHVVRGGAWWTIPVASHSGYRMYAGTLHRSDAHGFRVVRVRTANAEGSTMTTPSEPRPQTTPERIPVAAPTTPATNTAKTVTTLARPIDPLSRSNDLSVDREAPMPVEGKKYRIINVKTGGALDVMNSARNIGARIKQSIPGPQLSQLWSVVKPKKGETLIIRNENSNLVLNMVNHAPYNVLVQFNSDFKGGGGNDDWSLKREGDAFRITTMWRGYHLIAAHADGGVERAVPTGGDHELWRFVEFPDPASRRKGKTAKTP